MLVFVAVCLLLLSAFFSAAETAFTAYNRIRMEALAPTNARASLVLKISGRFDRAISSILAGNTIVNIAITAIITLEMIRWFGPAGTTYSTVIVAAAVLVFGEVSPKTLANESPERWAMLCAPLLQVFMWVFTPVSALFTLWRRLLSALFKSGKGQGITEQELLMVVAQAEREGAIHEEDRALIHRVIAFDDRRADEIKTPRVDIVGVAADATFEEINQVFLKTEYSRLPVYEETVDRIIGAIHQKDFYRAGTLEDIIKPVLFIAPSMKIAKLLRLLQQEHIQLAVITDEYGGCDGLVSVEDILEELVGEIYDEHDDATDDIVFIQEGIWRVSGSAEVALLFTTLNIESEAKSATVAGFIADSLGRIPAEGDSFEYHGFIFTALRVEGRRAVEVEVRLVSDDT